MDSKQNQIETNSVVGDNTLKLQPIYCSRFAVENKLDYILNDFKFVYE